MVVDEPVSELTLATVLEVTQDEVSAALAELVESYSDDPQKVSFWGWVSQSPWCYLCLSIVPLHFPYFFYYSLQWYGYYWWYRNGYWWYGYYCLYY